MFGGRKWVAIEFDAPAEDGRRVLRARLKVKVRLLPHEELAEFLKQPRNELSATAICRALVRGWRNVGGDTRRLRFSKQALEHLCRSVPSAAESMAVAAMEANRLHLERQNIELERARARLAPALAAMAEG